MRVPSRAQVVQHRLIATEAREGPRMVERLALIAELDELGTAQREGFRSTAHWLSVECRLESRTARDYVRVAHRLQVWPSVHAALADGRLTYSQCRILARASMEEDEAGLLAVALRSTVAGLERHVRALRSAPSADPVVAEGARAACTLNMVWNEDGTLSFWGRLEPVAGAALIEAVDTAAERMAAPPECDGARRPSLGARRADALGEIARSGCPRATLMLHADLASLTGDPDGEILHLHDGPSIPPALARRLTCDAMVSIAGLNHGRTRRLVTPSQRRALADRDGRICFMPGCDHTHGLDAHHLHHWTKGGPTDLDNLALTCSYHHRLFHEGGWNATRHGRTVIITNPHGEIIHELHRPSRPRRSRSSRRRDKRHASLVLSASGSARDGPPG